MDRDLDDWLAALVASPGDGAVRLIFADYLAEQGDYAGEAGERWAAREGKWPLRFAVYGLGGWYVNLEQEHANLPDSFCGIRTHGLSGNNDPQLIECERAFLLRCRELEWDESGPVDVSTANGVSFTRTVATSLTL